MAKHDDNLTFEEKLMVQIAFNKSVGEDDAARYAVHLQESINGLTANHEAFVAEYIRQLDELATLRAENTRLDAALADTAAQLTDAVERAREAEAYAQELERELWGIAKDQAGPQAQAE
jgi:hypothetical protein